MHFARASYHLTASANASKGGQTKTIVGGSGPRQRQPACNKRTCRRNLLCRQYSPYLMIHFAFV